MARGALKFFRLTRYHWCLFGPLNLANLWKAVNRIRFKMGKFSRTQIRTLNSFSPKKKKYFSNFWGVLYILPTCFIGVLTKLSQKNWPIFGPPRARFWPNFGVIWGSQGFFWLKCSSSIADWSKKVASWCPQMKNKAPQKNKSHFGQNRNAKVARMRAQTCHRAIFYHFFGFMWNCRKNHQDPTSRCRVIC